MGEAKRRRLIQAAEQPKGPRTVADIMEGRAPGVFGWIWQIKDGPTVNGWFRTKIVTLLDPIGLPLCTGCHVTRPHAWAIWAGLGCGPEYPMAHYDQAKDLLHGGGTVGLVGDIVQHFQRDPEWRRGMPVISCFLHLPWSSGRMTVPDRASIAVNQHCVGCPVELPA